MKLKLNKRQLKNLSNDPQVLPADMTPQIAGGGLGNDGDDKVSDGIACRLTDASCGLYCHLEKRDKPADN